jgi:hypothetical protein
VPATAVVPIPVGRPAVLAHTRLLGLEGDVEGVLEWLGGRGGKRKERLGLAAMAPASDLGCARGQGCNSLNRQACGARRTLPSPRRIPWPLSRMYGGSPWQARVHRGRARTDRQAGAVRGRRRVWELHVAGRHVPRVWCSDRWSRAHLAYVRRCTAARCAWARRSVGAGRDVAFQHCFNSV